MSFRWPNIDPKRSHCNGIYYLMTSVSDRPLKARMLGWPQPGSSCWFPATISPTDTDLFQLSLSDQQYVRDKASNSAEFCCLIAFSHIEACCMLQPDVLAIHETFTSSLISRSSKIARCPHIHLQTCVHRSSTGMDFFFSAKSQWAAPLSISLRYLKRVLLISCVLWIFFFSFSEHWQSTLFKIF